MRRTPRPGGPGKVPSATVVAVEIADAAEGPPGDRDAQRGEPARGVRHQPLAAGLVERRPAAIEDGHRETGEPGLDRRRQAGRSAADDDEIAPPLSHPTRPRPRPARRARGGHRRARSGRRRRPGGAGVTLAGGVEAVREVEPEGLGAPQLAGGGARQRPRGEDHGQVDVEPDRREDRRPAGRRAGRGPPRARRPAAPRRRAPAPRRRRPRAASRPRPRSPARAPGTASTARSISSGEWLRPRRMTTSLARPVR